MRAIAEYHVDRAPPLLRLYIHGAPHRRQHIQVISRYRDELYRAGKAAGIKMPIHHDLDLRVTFINPCSPDLDNLVVALYRALDGSSHLEPTILADDGLVQEVHAGKFYPCEATKADRPVRRLSKLVA